MNRRGFILGMAGILATATAPAIVRASSIMPVHQALPAELRAVTYTFDEDTKLFVPEDRDQVQRVVMEFGVDVDRRTGELVANYLGRR